MIKCWDQNVFACKSEGSEQHSPGSVPKDVIPDTTSWRQYGQNIHYGFRGLQLGDCSVGT